MRACHLVLALTLAGGLCFADHKDAKGYERFVREIRHELVMLPYYGVFDNLAYRVDGYKVTLMGQVTRPTLKSDAERVVKDIEGVEQVVNNIEVLPLSPNDDRIRMAGVPIHLWTAVSEPVCPKRRPADSHHCE